METSGREGKSICYMSLAEAFLTRLRQDAEHRTRTRILKGVGVHVLPVTMDRQDFIYDYLTKLYDQKKGTFSKPKIFAKQTIYECERSNACKGRSSGDPTKTRANGCNAYVSFMFEEGATVTACVIRFRLIHNGHDPTNREESRVSRIDLTLKVMIEININNGMKISDIMNEIAKWNKIHKNTDHRNRRYFPTRQDIQQLALSLKKPLTITRNITFDTKKPRKYDTVNKDNISRLIRTELRETCVYYQSQTITGANPRPLIIVLQNNDMRENFIHHGQHMVFIEKNYEGLRQYGNAVYVIVVRDDSGNGFPVAYIITSDDDGLTFVQALQKLTTRCQIKPRVFFLDREIHTLSTTMAGIYPESNFFICWYHVAQDVHRWLQNSVVSGKEHAEVRRVLVHYILQLKGYTMEDDFMLAASEMQQRIDFEAFTTMFQAEWITCATKWSDFGRSSFYGSSDAIAATERFFLRIHHRYLKGLHTRKSLEKLLRLITHNVMEYRNFVDGMVNMSLLMEGTASEQAGLLLNQGWSQLVTWQGKWIALVPCQDLLETTYRVNLITMECECPTVTFMGPCLHLCLATALAQLRDGPSPEQERHRLALEAYENSDYIIDCVSCVTFHNGIICVTKLKTCKCTCIASAFDIECVGIILLKITESAEAAVSYTVPDPSTSARLSPTLSTSTKNINNSVISIKSKEVPAFTITMASQTERNNSSEDSFHVIQEPIIIQTHTGVGKKSNTLPQVMACGSSEAASNNLSSINIIKKERDDESFGFSNSSQAIIEKLYQWSKSKDFADSVVLNDMLKETHNLIWGKQKSLLPKQPELKGRQIKELGNKKLRAVIRAVKRQRPIKEEEDFEPTSAMMPSTKVSRSGRTIKIKEEPDFIM
ncbi:uncharacterized protein [Procambarus clarkii]|uniref:uncharacterized protein n=1 Tax=Procambarus clarkii TaxID=6728 RepID=UPI00374313E9